MKKLIYIIVLIFGFQTSQAQIKRYKPKNANDSFLEWLEIGVSGFYGKVLDKQMASSQYSEFQGIAIDGRIKIKNKFFLHGNFEIGQPSYTVDLVDHIYPNYSPENYLFRSEFTKAQAGFGFLVVGHHKSLFSFAPIAPSLGILNYSVRFNYFINDEYIKDGSKTETLVGYGNLSTARLRLGKFNIFASFYVFSTLKNSDNYTAFIDHFEADEYEPQFFMYTAQLGIQLRL